MPLHGKPDLVTAGGTLLGIQRDISSDEGVTKLEMTQVAYIEQAWEDWKELSGRITKKAPTRPADGLKFTDHLQSRWDYPLACQKCLSNHKLRCCTTVQSDGEAVRTSVGGSYALPTLPIRNTT